MTPNLEIVDDSATNKGKILKKNTNGTDAMI